VPSQVTRRSYNGQADGEIMFAHGHQDGGGDRYGSGPSLVLLGLVVHPL
jgi:hypothetical protein